MVDSTRQRAAEWLRRYGLPECAGTLGAMGASALAMTVTDNVIAAAYAGTLGENLGFYGIIVGREVLTDRRRARRANLAYDLPAVLGTAVALLVEFGPAEVFDSVLVRPLAMALGIRRLGGRWGVVAGKLVADLLFYLPVIITWEIRQRLAGRSGAPES